MRERVKAPKTPPSKSHAARAARGRVRVLVTLSPETRDLLVAMAEERGWTRSDVVELAIRRTIKASEKA